MSTRSANKQSNTAALCDYCHQRPKFGNFQYCGKSCAAEAAKLCDQCHLKPKFGNFDHCSKACFQLAQAQGGTAGAATGLTGQAQKSNKGGPTNGRGKGSSGQTAPVIPVPVAQVMQRTFQAVQANAPQIAAHLPPSVANMVPTVVNSKPFQHIAQGQHLPKTAPAKQQATPRRANNGNNNATAGAGPTFPSGQATIHVVDVDGESDEEGTASDSTLHEPTDCLIPGCTKPVYDDPTKPGPSMFCSKTHREEAVSMGLVPPCIMCLALPQSDTDHFCSKVCREEALTKPKEYWATSA